jgi:tetraacyldisaccharide 4'-kinase
VPERFFGQLEAAGLVIQRHAFADHAALVAADLVFADNRPVLMTQKDAVKCRHLADARLWYVPAELADPDGLADAVRQRLARPSEAINTR